MNPQARRWTVGLLSATLITGAGAIAGPASAAEVAPVPLVIGLKPGHDASAKLATLARLGLQGAEAQGQARKGLLAEIGAKAISVPANRVDLALALLRQDPAVAYASVDHVAKVVDVTPNDTVYAKGQPELPQLNVPAAWDTTTGTDSVVVAVVDSGVTPVGDLADQLVPGTDFVAGDNDPRDGGDFPHGTVVASLIAAKGNNGTGMAGVCWECKIMPVRVMDHTGSGPFSTIAQGIVYAAQNNADIINLSLGSPYNDPVVANAVAYANARGVLVVAAAGNDNKTSKFYPAAYPDVLSVGGTNTYNTPDVQKKSSFSNYGTNWVDVAAPGITAGMTKTGKYCHGDDTTPDDTSCGEIINGTRYYYVQGTSFASPLVAGIAGLVKSAHPTYTGWALQSAITRSTKTGTARNWTRYGLVDAAKALTMDTDARVPTIGYISPGQNAKVHGNVAIKPVGATDSWSGVMKAELYVNGKWADWAYKAPFAPTLKTGTRNGPIKVKLKVTDKAGNAAWTGERTVIADNIKPKVALTSAKKNKAKVSGTVTIKAKASDVSGISKVQLLVNGKVVATDTTAGYSLSFKVKNQAKKMNVRLRAYDKAGNYLTTAVLRTYYRA
ncbi:S8 family serine peptidase [Actinoplanes palleronii]|uniref:Peptidase S8/S53 domain-containing protein n=1 Tax=Actinoplanes palleronii TaxID=113570 RepID=A0ABQ4B8I7_9ACTN|nr:S8 family serine peptidase [Actinoplanes palleronii]GIE66912.1 hypothetical protein Apa02nite_030200 [Actinoplanes palleronii]